MKNMVFTSKELPLFVEESACQHSCNRMTSAKMEGLFKMPARPTVGKDQQCLIKKVAQLNKGGDISSESSKASYSSQNKESGGDKERAWHVGTPVKGSG